MGTLDATPQLVNSKKYAPRVFTSAMIQAERRCAGAITYASGSGSPPGRCLAGNPLSGSAVLVDYNYVLTCAHSYDTLLRAVGLGAMAAGKVWVVFNNEYTAETADAKVKTMEPSRPTANFRHDLEAWVGTSCGLDYALVKIVWQGDGFSQIGRMPTLPDPDKFSDVHLIKRPLLFVGQYTHAPPDFSTHVALSSVTGVGVARVWDGCGESSPEAYGEFNLKVNRPGPSGSGVYDLKNGKVRLVGIFGKGSGSMKYFVPLDRIYADNVKAIGSAKPPGTIKDMMRAICKQRWKDGMPKI